MKRILLLSLCAITYNTTWTSAPATSSSAQPATNQSNDKPTTFHIKIAYHKDLDIFQLKDTSAPSAEGTINIIRFPKDHLFPDGNVLKNEYYLRLPSLCLRSAHPLVVAYSEKADASDASEMEKEVVKLQKDMPLIKAIEQAEKKAKELDLYGRKKCSVWLASDSSAKLIEFKDRKASHQASKLFSDNDHMNIGDTSSDESEYEDEA